MKKKSIFLSIIIFLIVIIPSIYANPITPIYESRNAVIYIITSVGLLITSVSIELVIIMLFIRKNRLHQNFNIFYKSILVVNLITFLITQIVAFLTLMFSPSNIYLYILIYILIEFIPISIESFIYIRVYNFLNQNHSFRIPIDRKKIILSTFTANMATFLFGALLFFYFPPII
ncbi:MAG: hypothetical protein ACFFEY_19675 [Candidatus Thorarchaeota archaeon]